MSHNGTASDVMLQGFHWRSSESNNPVWYQIISQNAAKIRDARFDLVWFPPPSQSVDSQGYLPNRWNRLDTKYGTADQLQQAITSLRPLRVLSDVVVNHRCGANTGGSDFEDPPFMDGDQSSTVVSDDECGCGRGNRDTGENQGAARDLDHSNGAVQSTITTWLQMLKQRYGYAGWRYDEVKGYGGYFVGLYNAASDPYLSVGEFWENSDRQQVVDWINATGAQSMAFDFPTRSLLRDAIQQQQFWKLKTIDGQPTGVIGWWPSMSVTFVENHDTEPDRGDGNNFGNDTQVLQAYAYLLTHPGIPCVFWSHYFDWGNDVQDKINQLIRVRKDRGIGRDSTVNIAAADDSLYAAIIDDAVAVKIGPGPWSPDDGWRVDTDGNDFAVWVRI